MKRILATISGKGGVGKSTCAVRIARALCSLGEKVLLVDLDCGLRCLDALLSVSDSLVFDLSDVLEGHAPEDAILPCDEVKGLYLLPAPARYMEIDGEKLSRFLLSASGFDRIILDFPAGCNFPFIDSIADITDFLIVANADTLGIRDSEIISYELLNKNIHCRLILNKYQLRLVRKDFLCGIDDIIDSSGCRLLGVVPFERRSFKLSHDILSYTGCTERAFARIARRIYGYPVKLPRIRRIEKGK